MSFRIKICIYIYIEENNQSKREKELLRKMKEYEKSEKTEEKENDEHNSKSDHLSLFDENPTVLIRYIFVDMHFMYMSTYACISMHVSLRMYVCI